MVDHAPNSNCPKCGPVYSTCADSRPTTRLGEITIRRRRKCSCCGHGFTTYEIPLEHFKGAEKAIKKDIIKKLLNSI